MHMVYNKFMQETWAINDINSKKRKSPLGCFALSLINGLHPSAKRLDSHCHVTEAGEA